MNIDAKFFGIIIFLVSQTAAGIWWAASLSSEVERLAGIQGTSIPSIENQHSRLFEALQGNQVQQSTKGYGYD